MENSSQKDMDIKIILNAYVYKKNMTIWYSFWDKFI